MGPDGWAYGRSSTLVVVRSQRHVLCARYQQISYHYKPFFLFFFCTRLWKSALEAGEEPAPKAQIGPSASSWRCSPATGCYPVRESCRGMTRPATGAATLTYECATVQPTPKLWRATQQTASSKSRCRLRDAAAHVPPCQWDAWPLSRGHDRLDTLIIWEYS